MQAVQFTEHGGTDVIEYGEYETLELAGGEVRVAIRAGALNHLDVWTRRGLPGLDLNRIFWNQLQVIGSTMGTPGEVDDVLELVWDGTFEPRIREVLPMSETARGHELLEEREGFGKVVVIPDRHHDG